MEKANFREKLLHKSKVIGLAWGIIFSTLQFPETIHAKDNTHKIETKFEKPTDDLTKINENMLVDSEWNIYLLKHKQVKLQPREEKKKDVYIVDWEYQVKKSDIISLQEYLDRFKNKVKWISYLKDLKYTDRFESNLIEYQGKKVFMEDLFDKRYRVHWKTEYDQLNSILLMLPHYTEQGQVYIELNNVPNKWYALVLKKEADELAEKYHNNLLKAKEEIDNFDIKPYLKEWFEFKSERDAILAKIYAYMYVHIKYGNPYEKWLLNQNGCLTLENREGNCDGLSKVFISLADLYWIPLKKEEGILWDVRSWGLNGHAWVSYQENWEEYIFDPTNEGYIKNLDFKIWGTNFFKVPKYISEHFYFKDWHYDRNTINSQETVNASKAKLLELKEKIKEDKKNGNNYFLHNDDDLQEVFKLKEKQTK